MFIGGFKMRNSFFFSIILIMILITFYGCASTITYCNGKLIKQNIPDECKKPSFEKFTVALPKDRLIDKIKRILVENGFDIISDDKSGIICTNYRLLLNDECFENKIIAPNLKQYGKLRIIISETDSPLKTLVKIGGFISMKGKSLFGNVDINEKEASQISHCHPFVQKFSQLIQGLKPCPCHYYTGECF